MCVWLPIETIEIKIYIDLSLPPFSSFKPFCGWIIFLFVRRKRVFLSVFEDSTQKSYLLPFLWSALKGFLFIQICFFLQFIQFWFFFYLFCYCLYVFLQKVAGTNIKRFVSSSFLTESSFALCVDYQDLKKIRFSFLLFLQRDLWIIIIAATCGDCTKQLVWSAFSI